MASSGTFITSITTNRIERLAFNECKQVISQRRSDWSRIKFMIFDAPSREGTFRERLSFLKDLIPKYSRKLKVVRWDVCKGIDKLKKQLEKTIKNGGEGLVLRNPNSLYTFGRSNEMLKVKVNLYFKFIWAKVEK